MTGRLDTEAVVGLLGEELAHGEERAEVEAVHGDGVMPEGGEGAWAESYLQ